MVNNFDLIYWSQKLTLKKSAGQLERLTSLLAKATIDLHPHQIHTAMYAFNSPLSRGCIMADEVGLGKTIEAGIVLAQLWLENKRKILLIVPASLRTQWQNELENLFGLKSTVFDSQKFDEEINSSGSIPFNSDGIYIVSSAFVYKRAKLIEKIPWNLIVIDEAHRFRRVYRGRDASKMAYSIREAIRNKPKLLLSATPLQNNLMELYGIVSFIDEKILGTPYYFKTRYVDAIIQSKNPDRQREILHDLHNLLVGTETQEGDSCSTGVLTRTLRRQVQEYVKFTKRHSTTYDFTPTEEEQTLYEKVSEYLARPKLAAIDATQRNLMILVYRKLLASSSFAIAPTLDRLRTRLENELKLRQQERKNDNFDKKNDDINESFEDIEDNDLEQQEQKQIKKEYRVQKEFTDEEIKKEMLELESFYKLAISIKENTKAIALIKAIKELFKQAKEKKWPEKMVIFTESARTQKYIESVLDRSNIGYIPFNGSNNSQIALKAYDEWAKIFKESAKTLSKSVALRQALIYTFKNDPNKKIFLTTEAGSEGLNLQFANILINYDLPWNPQRVEQRIGRIHRYGQKLDVLIVNLLNTKNYADRRVLELLTEKLHLFDGLFGSSDEILGSIGAGIDFEKQILEIYQSCRTQNQIDQAFNELQNIGKLKISEQIGKLREEMLDYFDPGIIEVFKKTKQDIYDKLSKQDQDLLLLSKLYYQEKIVKHPIIDSCYQINNENYLYREETIEERGKISRISIEHPIIKNILDYSSNIVTNPIPVLKIRTSNYQKLSSQLITGSLCMLYIFKLKISAVEEDEVLIPIAFILKENKWIPLSADISQYMAEVEHQYEGETINSTPQNKEDFLKEWGIWKKQIIDKYEQRNHRLYRREYDRILKYWDSYSVRIKDKLEKVNQEMDEFKRKRENTIDFDETKIIDEKIEKLLSKQQQLQLDINKEMSYSLEEQQKEIKNLKEKLQLTQNEELIAIAQIKLI